MRQDVINYQKSTTMKIMEFERKNKHTKESLSVFSAEAKQVRRKWNGNHIL